MESVKQSLLRIAPFTQPELEAVLSKLRSACVKKGCCIVKEGTTCTDFYFIHSGAFRQYAIDDAGGETTFNLYTPGEWFFDYKSLITQVPAEGHIEAVKTSEVSILSLYDFHELVKVADIFFRFGHIFQQGIRNQDFRSNDLSPLEKYERLIERSPDILKHFSLRHVASYLGITPETLSRVRRRFIS